MACNIGKPDRVGRIALGLAILGLFFVGPKTSWGLLGVVPLMTGLFGWCPLYHWLGWSTDRLPAARRRS